MLDLFKYMIAKHGPYSLRNPMAFGALRRVYPILGLAVKDIDIFDSTE